MCAFGSCSKQVHAKGFCNTHYKPAVERGLIGPRNPCAKDGCSKFAAHSDGLCITHHRATKDSFKAKEKRRREKQERREKRSQYDRKYNATAKRAAAIKRYQVRREEQIKLATPTWLTEEHHWLIEQFYKACEPGFAVDHIIPLLGKEVCGLHVPWNLQVLTVQENSQKGNRLP